jgi:hypothetical protein
MAESSEEEEFLDTAVSPRRRSVTKPVSYADPGDDDDDDDDDDDSEDDIPLAALAAKMKQTNGKSKTNGSSKKSSPATKKKKVTKAPPPKKAPSVATTSSSSSSGNKTYEFASDALYQSESLKGLLIQRLLCRWWYAYEWPDRKTLPATPPPHYDPLEGFPGVYVCTHGDDVGKLLDRRDPTRTPSFSNFVRKPAAQLQTLLLQALGKQKALLEADVRESTAEEKELQTLIKWATKVNPDKADKEAAKVLKASRLKLQ